jgi:hypothetical protein
MSSRGWQELFFEVESNSKLVGFGVSFSRYNIEQFEVSEIIAAATNDFSQQHDGKVLCGFL